jgi:hypothetical protein
MFGQTSAPTGYLLVLRFSFPVLAAGALTLLRVATILLNLSTWVFLGLTECSLPPARTRRDSVLPSMIPHAAYSLSNSKNLQAKTWAWIFFT